MELSNNLTSFSRGLETFLNSERRVGCQEGARVINRFFCELNGRIAKERGLSYRNDEEKGRKI